MAVPYAYCTAQQVIYSHMMVLMFIRKFNSVVSYQMTVRFVRELMGWVRNVVLINVYLDLENPRGSGFWVGGYMSQVREWGS
jgi:hypothetical protein